MMHGENISFVGSGMFTMNYTLNSFGNLMLTIDQIFSWIQLTSILLSFVGNLLIIFGTCRQVSQLTINKLVINYLAFCDLSYSFLQIFFVHRKFSDHTWHFGSTICTLTVLSPCAIITSLFIITFIAFERHRSILHPLQTRFGKWKITLFIFLVFVLSLVLQFPYMIHMKVVEIGLKKDCVCAWDTEMRKYWDLLVFTLTYPLPILVFLYCYARIIARVTRRFEHTNCIILRGSTVMRHKKLCVTLATIVIVFVLTTSPNQMLILWSDFGEKSASDSAKTYVILYSLAGLVHLHSFANPLIYSLSDAKFRKLLCGIVNNRQQLRKTLIISLRSMKKHEELSKLKNALLDEDHHQPCSSIDITQETATVVNGRNSVSTTGF